MPKALVNGINIHYQTSGQGPDLVLVHGATGNMAFWYLSSFPALREEFRVTVYDMRGHGYSDATPSGYTSADMAADLVGLLDHLGVERAHILGHSFGGVVALHTAALYPERVDSLILADPEIPALRDLCDVREWPYWEAWNARLREFGIDVPDEKWDDLDYVLRQSLYIPMAYGMRKGQKRKSARLLRLLDDTTAIDDFRELAGLTMDKIRQVKHLTLAIYGELSPFLPACQYLTENMPNCKSVIVPTGHFHPALEPEEFVGHVKGFLRDPAGFASKGPPKREEETSHAVSPSVQRNVLDNLQPRKFRSRTMRDRKILLVAPDFPQLFGSHYELMMGLPFVQWKSIMTPLDIAAIAALTPDDIQVDLWDESVHGRITDSTEMLQYDLVGITGHAAHLSRAGEIAEIFSMRETPVAIGGVGVSLVPERCRRVADILFIGEMELTWPQFIADWRAGNYRREYRQIAKPDLTTSPSPRWDSLADEMEYYFAGAVQTTRGCPSDCQLRPRESGDAAYLYGRRLRHKPIDRVLEEVTTLERLGLEHIFFTDCDFVVDPGYTKELLRQLAPLNRSFRKPVRFSAQASINVAKDEETLELLTDANFLSLFMEIRTPSTDHGINVRNDLIADCRKVMSYGLTIRAGLVVGTDHDTIRSVVRHKSEIFDEQFELVQEAGIPFPSPSMLRVTPGTDLWRRFHREGRVLEVDEESIYALRMATTNIIPKHITRRKLMSGYMNLIERLADWDNLVERIKVFLSSIDPEKILRTRYRTQADVDAAMRSLLAFVDSDAREAISSLLSYTSEHAPFMMERVLSIVAQGYSYVGFAQSLRQTIRKRIDLEESVDLEQLVNGEIALIPEDFEPYYYDIFPETLARLHDGLADKARVYDALIELFADLLLHSQKPFDAASENHKISLHELTDHIIAKMNGAPGELSSVFTQDDLAAPGAEREVAAEVLKAVEQELRGQRPLHAGFGANKKSALDELSH